MPPVGGTYGAQAQPTQAQLNYFTNTLLPQILSGQNIADIPWQGQNLPATGNASAQVAAHQIARGTPYATIPGGVETIFSEGPLTHGLPIYTPSWYSQPMGPMPTLGLW